MMLKRILIIVPALLLLMIPELDAINSPDPDKKLEKEVAKLFDAGAEVRELPVIVKGDKLSDLFHQGDRLFAVENSVEALGYVLSTSAMGRYDYFDYSIFFSKDLAVIHVVVTTYRSSHGAGICSKGWLKQFNGYRGEEISIGKDVDSVSGGTISATSLVEDMKRTYKLMEEFSNMGTLN